MLRGLSRIKTIRVRLIAYSVGLFGLTLLLFCAFLLRVFTANSEKEFDTDLYNYSVDIAYGLDVNLFGRFTLSRNLLGRSEKIFPFELGETMIQIRSPSGEVLARTNRVGNAALPLTASTLQVLLSGGVEFSTIPASEAERYGLPAQKHRMLSYYFEKTPGMGLILQVVAPTTRVQRDRQELIAFFSFSIPVVLIIGVFGGILLSRRALRPVMLMIERTKRISAQELSARLPVPDSHDEIQELALTVNSLLERLESAFRSQQSFVSDASHQLKTPLAILRGEIDLMRSRPRTAEETAQFLTSASEEVGYLSRMIEDLLVLARIDTGASALTLSRVDIDETLVDVVARMNRVAAPKGVDLMLNLADVESPGRLVMGDIDLLRSLFESVIDNAVKYSPSTGGKVEVRASTDPGPEGGVRIEVQDHGQGIPQEDLPKIFDRFYRSKSTSHQRPGSGLGLAIAQRIVEVHRGTIHAESEIGRGTRITVTLPALARTTA